MYNLTQNILSEIIRLYFVLFAIRVIDLKSFVFAWLGLGEIHHLFEHHAIVLLNIVRVCCLRHISNC